MQTRFCQRRLWVPILLLAGLIFAVAVPAQNTLSHNQGGEATFPYTPALGIQASNGNVVWPLMPGDTLRSLAEKAYPNNGELQQRLMAKTIALSREHGIKLGPDDVFSHPQLIVMPSQPKLNQMTQPIKTIDALAVKKVSPNLALSLNLHESSALAFKTAPAKPIVPKAIPPLASQSPPLQATPAQVPSASAVQVATSPVASVPPSPDLAQPNPLAPVVSPSINLPSAPEISTPQKNIKPDQVTQKAKRVSALPTRVEHYDENTIITIDTTVRSDEELAAMKAHSMNMLSVLCGVLLMILVGFWCKLNPTVVSQWLEKIRKI